MKKDLNKEVTYWCYVDSNKPTDIIFSDNAGLTITINDISPDFKFSTQLQQLSIEKIKGKELNLERFNLNQCVIRNSGMVHFFLKELTINFKDIDYTLKMKGQEVSLDEAYTILQEKNVYELLDQFLTSKTKSNHHFNYGQTGVMKYYCQKEEKLEKFQELFVDGQFCLPDNEKEREELLNFADLEEPGSGLFLSKEIPTKQERLSFKQTQSKVSKPKMRT